MNKVVSFLLSLDACSSSAIALRLVATPRPMAPKTKTFHFQQKSAQVKSDRRMADSQESRAADVRFPAVSDVDCESETPPILQSRNRVLLRVSDTHMRLLSYCTLVDPASIVCLFQRLSHANLRANGFNSRSVNGSLNQQSSSQFWRSNPPIRITSVTLRLIRVRKQSLHPTQGRDWERGDPLPSRSCGSGLQLADNKTNARG